jgi:hypothetical protein
MLAFIAYFGILGFKEFISNNDKAYVDHHLNHIYRESQHAVCKGHTVQGPNATLLPDFNFAEINCLHISDSILFWTESATQEEFLRLVEVCYKFLYTCLHASFPVRGCLVAGDIEYRPLHIVNAQGKRFDNSTLYGRGLIDAYEKAEAQDWAGCYIDQSVFDLKVKDENGNDTPERIISEQTVNTLIYNYRLIYYPVPFKDGSQSYEHAFRHISQAINNVHLRNLAMTYTKTFNRHMNGNELPPGAKHKLFNTIKFLEAVRMTTEEMIGQPVQQAPPPAS